ncbi:MAG: NAD-glutamate dehydrogenase [Gammaproteobacteria bacterium]|nr:MAG: NAD-glutamate dehydrogenase [Gammaproteobacteria bacterium]
MKLTALDERDEFFELLDREIDERLKAEEASSIKAFARIFYESSPLEELREKRLSDAYGSTVSCWKFLQQYKAGPAKVEVSNPNLEENGWQSTHTVITLLMPNMPFIVDSVRMALARLGLNIFAMHNAVLKISRTAGGKFKTLHDRQQGAGKKDVQCEAFMYVEVDRHSSTRDLEQIRNELQTVLEEVATAVSDYPLMKAKAIEMSEAFSKKVKGVDDAARKEAQAFLDWLAQDHFTFLGYDEYSYEGEGEELVLKQVPGSELGILKSHQERPRKLTLSGLPRQAREAILGPDICIFSKSAERSRIHRPAYPDYVSIKRYDARGKMVGEVRFLGLYTFQVYNERTEDIPLVRQKIRYVREQAGFAPQDYAGKELDQILAVYPRDELFQISQEQLLETALGILYIQERRKIRLFMHEDVYGQFVTALVFVPRDIYSTRLRVRIGELLAAELGAEDLEFFTYYSESVLARTQFILRVPPAENRELPVEELQAKIIAAAQSWQDGLIEALNEAHGEERASRLIQEYSDAFPSSYREDFSPRRAVIDIDHISTLSAESPLAMSFYKALEEDEKILHFKLYHEGGSVPLSDVLPVFENLGLRVLGEHPYEVTGRSGKTIWIHDFSLQSSDETVIDISRIRKKFEDLFLRVWVREAESDTFNRLVLAAHLDWRQISMLRSYARYMRQTRFGYSQTFIANTLANHVHITQLLLELFEVRFDPSRYKSHEQCEAAQQNILNDINAALEQVANLSEDKVLRRYVEMIRATVRTNYYQQGSDGGPKPYMSFKMLPSKISAMPKPLPMFEIFVYSPQVEGVHLRGGKVARGGLRWSDRYEDYRTEILGLVKAQQVKNSVIVPVGAKGGFVAKQLPEGDREAWLAEGVSAYKTFIRGLLDVTDNNLGGEVIPPPDVVRHDEDDYYLVVAADKGTATFSDIANGISAEYNFWLGDAFASGGSQGYDHKKMGITARGAWVSVQRHFRELGLNTDEDVFTAIGVGDMSGDVFGNGMLLSDKMKLVAAFNHLHIFVDPDPDPAVAFRERQRLFNLPRSTWADYDAKLISKGGGVFSRSAKSIPISAEMKSRFGIKQDRLPPNMLIKAILKAEADLLWFGGIGTYVKSSEESHADAGDKANDAIRINGSDLRVRIVGEGANLGMTQRGRIEYAMKGGRLNTDFVDNSAGVDCSDHEVNIKILLNGVVANGDMTMKQRNKLLEDMTDQVAWLVLKNNYRQTQALTIARFEASERIEEYRRLINHLEGLGKLDRALEYIPDDDTITERKSRGEGLTRPELCVLNSYVRGYLKEVLIDSELVDDPYLVRELHNEFPAVLVRNYADQVASHRLRREIVATQLANDLVNHMGISFVERMRQSTGATVESIVKAYVIARDTFSMDAIWSQIEALDYKVSAETQTRMMTELMRLVRRATRWFLRNRRRELNIEMSIEAFRDHVESISTILPDLLAENQRVQNEERKQFLLDAGVPEDLATTVAGTLFLYSALGIIEAHEESQKPLDYVARTFFAVGEVLDLQWFNDQLNKAKPATHWQALARESFREDLDWQQRSLTVGILGLATESEEIDARIEAWTQRHAELIERWRAMLTELKASKQPEMAMYSVALRELLDLAQSTVHCADC